MKRKKSSPLLDPVYHVLYNYHVYWIFIFTVTKEPSAHSSSLQLSSDISCETLGTDQSDPTPPPPQPPPSPSSSLIWPIRAVLENHFVYLFLFLFPIWPRCWKIIPKLVPRYILDCSSCFLCVPCQNPQQYYNFHNNYKSSSFSETCFAFLLDT